MPSPNIIYNWLEIMYEKNGESKISNPNPISMFRAGEGVSGLVYSFAHLRRLSLALLQVLELDCGDIKIIEERSIGKSGLNINT